MESVLDIIGAGLWILMFVTPLIIVPLAWKYIDGNKVFKVMVRLIMSGVLSFFLYCVGLGLLFRHGFGPG